MARPSPASSEVVPPRVAIPVTDAVVETRAPSFRDRAYLRAGALLAISGVALVYGQVLGNYFHADDFANLQNVANLSLPRFVLAPGAGHIYFLRNVAYELLYAAFGTDTRWHFGAVLLTHLVNVGLLYALVWRLTASVRLACFAAVLWGAAPIHQETLGWYAVYGHVLVATLVLIVLLRLAGRVVDGAPVTTAEAAVWTILVLLGAVTFGVGVGVALVFPVVLILLPATRTTAGARRLLVLLPVLTLALYAAWQRLYQVAYGTDGAHVVYLLALLRAWGDVLLMLGQLCAAGIAGLLGGFLLLPDTFPTPAAYGIAIGFALAMLAGLVAGPAPVRRWIVVLLVLALGAYAIVAAGRGGFLASLHAPANGGGTSRYHYVATLFLCVATAVLCAWLGDTVHLGTTLRTTLLVLWLAATATAYGLGDFQVDHHPNDRRSTEKTLARIRQAIDAAPPGKAALVPNRFFPPALFPNLFAGWAGLYTIYYPDGTGRPVLFVEHEPVVNAQAVPGSRLARVMLRLPPRH